MFCIIGATPKLEVMNLSCPKAIKYNAFKK